VTAGTLTQRLPGWRWQVRDQINSRYRLSELSNDKGALKSVFLGLGTQSRFALRQPRRLAYIICLDFSQFLFQQLLVIQVAVVAT
jgi:hypothetical protein